MSGPSSAYRLDAPPNGDYPQPNYCNYQPVGQTCNNSTTVVVGQPQAVPALQIVDCKPNNYMALSIFTLLCCCWIFGIVSLMFAMQVDSAYYRGDVLGAQSASRSARTWNIVGIMWGSVTLVLVVIANIIWIPIALADDANDYDY